MRSNRTLDDLPDDILGRVLYLLPTKDRAMSEAVSKSWRRASLGRHWREICFDALGPAQVRWLKLITNRNSSSLHVFEGVFTPETPVDTVLQYVGHLQNLRHLELKAIFLDPIRMQRLSHLTNLEWLACGYAPYDVDEGQEFDENNEVIVSITLDSFAIFPQLRHLSVVLGHSLHNPGDPIWRVRLGSRFSGLTQLRSLKLVQIHTLYVDANLLRVAARLSNFELQSLRNELSLEGQEFDTPELTRFVYNVASTAGGPLSFPLTAAPQLLELNLHGNCIEPVTQALDVCPKLTALDLAMHAKLTANAVRKWPDMPMLQSLHLSEFSPSHPYVLQPFSAYTSLERLTIHLRWHRNVLASPNSMKNLKVLTLASKDTKPFNLGGGLNHLTGLKILHLSMPHLTGEINLRSLEVLRLSFTSLQPRHRILGNLSRLHTLHIAAEHFDTTEILILAHAIGALRCLKNLVLLRLSQDKDVEDASSGSSLSLTRIILRSISNTPNEYNHVVIMDDGALVLERSIMPRAQYLELACSCLSLETEQAEEDWFYRTKSLRVLLCSTDVAYESTPASVVEKLGSSPDIKIKRIQNRISTSSDSTYTDNIEASKYEFSSLPPEFRTWSIYSPDIYNWC